MVEMIPIVGGAGADTLSGGSGTDLHGLLFGPSRCKHLS